MAGCGCGASKSQSRAKAQQVQAAKEITRQPPTRATYRRVLEEAAKGKTDAPARSDDLANR